METQTLTSLSILAGCLWDLGQSQEALLHYESVLEKRRLVLGETHPDTLVREHDTDLLGEFAGGHCRLTR